MNSYQAAVERLRVGVREMGHALDLEKAAMDGEDRGLKIGFVMGVLIASAMWSLTL